MYGLIFSGKFVFEGSSGDTSKENSLRDLERSPRLELHFSYRKVKPHSLRNCARGAPLVRKFFHGCARRSRGCGFDIWFLFRSRGQGFAIFRAQDGDALRCSLFVHVVRVDWLRGAYSQCVAHAVRRASDSGALRYLAGARRSHY